MYIYSGESVCKWYSATIPSERDRQRNRERHTEMNEKIIFVIVFALVGWFVVQINVTILWILLSSALSVGNHQSIFTVDYRLIRTGSSFQLLLVHVLDTK